MIPERTKAPKDASLTQDIAATCAPTCSPCPSATNEGIAKVLISALSIFVLNIIDVRNSFSTIGGKVPGTPDRVPTLTRRAEALLTVITSVSGFIIFTTSIVNYVLVST